MSNHVVARIEGGLGNQLFQYAAGRTLADKLGCDLLLDLRGLQIQNDRPFQLNIYKTRAAIATIDQLKNFSTNRLSKWHPFRWKIAQLLPIQLSTSIFSSKSFAFDSSFNDLKSPVCLVGYWQSEKYFNWNRKQLFLDIQLKNPLPKSNRWVKEIDASCSVALHIRRGDYVTNAAANAFHGMCDLAYYYKAVELLKLQLPYINVFVFSDELEWAKMNLKLDVPTHYVESNSVQSGHLDLELMRRCKHHIIANSSFSWWGAWLCTFPDQLVCAPARWFADLGTDTSDVVPDRWIKIL